MQAFFIPHQFPSLNEILAARGSHSGARGNRWYKNKDMKNNAIQAAIDACKANSIEPVDLLPVDLVLTWHCVNKRKDPDNIAAGVKYVLDGIVQAGVLPNDKWSEICSIRHLFLWDAIRPGVQVELNY